MLATLVDETRELTPADRIEQLRAVEAELRRLEAEAAVLVAQIGHDGAFRERGHLTISGFLRGELRWSQQQVTARRQLAGLVEQVPAVIEHLRAGAIGVAQAQAFGRAAANPRCGDQLVEHAELLLEHARVLPHHDFMLSIQRWEQFADSDGAHRDAEANHDSRRFGVSFHDGVGRIAAQCGAMDYAAFSEIFERYRHAEYLADWHDAVARYGVADAGMHLARTDAQRSWDAMMRMSLDAVSTPPGSQAPEPVVNLVCGLDTVETLLADAGLIPDDRTGEAPTPPAAAGADRCETSTGIPVTPAEVVQAMFHGRIRRVVFDTAGVVVDAGRLRRLFDGAMRDLMRLHSPTCIFPGCDRPATWCQIDHLTDWQHGGTTTAANAGPMCARHNQLKNSGFTVWRDPNGVYHTYHPDGTEIAPPPAPPGAAPPTWPDAA